MGSIYTVIAGEIPTLKNMFTQDFALNKISVKGEVSNANTTHRAIYISH